LAAAAEFDYQVVNDDLDQALGELSQIIGPWNPLIWQSKFST
jgi:guanylate kinase